jgi:hypothetical protein
MPYTGIGLDAFPVVQSHFYPGFYLGPEPHAHSLFLQLALDYGLLGLVCFIWLVGVVAARTVIAWRGRPGPEIGGVLAGSVAGLAAFVASGAIDTLWTAKPAVLFWILLGLVTATTSLILDEGERKGFYLGKVGSRWLLVLATAIGVLLISAIAFPAVAMTNLGLVRAHQGILGARTGGGLSERTLHESARALEGALARGPDDPSTLHALGAVYAWLGENDAALSALERAVALDSRDPIGRYAPCERWRRRVLGGPEGDRSEDLSRAYGQWMARYPDRAEGYVRGALAAESGGAAPAKARAIVNRGLEAGAEPEELLRHYDARLKGSTP